MRQIVKYGVFAAWGMVCVLYATVGTAEDYVMLSIENGYPPFFIIESTQEGDAVITGMAIEVLDLFEKEYPQYHRVYKSYPRKRVDRMMEQGEEIDLRLQSPLFVDETTARYYTFTETLFHTQDMVITHKSSNLQYEKPEDLYGKTVGAILGYKYNEFDELFAQGKITDYRVNTHQQAIQMLQLNRLDAFLGNIHVTPYFMKRIDVDRTNFNFSDKVLFEFDLALLVNNQKPELLRDLNGFIQKIKNDGTLAAIVNSYIK